MSDEAEPDRFVPAASWPNLELRARLLRQVRQFFAERDFLEVETPLLSAEVVIDQHVDPLAVPLPPASDGGPEDVAWLQTSPEAHMKRLMASGGRAIFQITRSFRGGERGRLHNREFTIVEWYRRGDTMAEGMSLLNDFCEQLLGRGPAERLSYQEAFLRFAEIDPLAADIEELAACCNAAGVTPPADLGGDRDAWLDTVLVTLVEPHLGTERPVILCDWPASQAALARTSAADPRVAERFELYVDGIELANGFHELADAGELRRRGRRANDERRAAGRAVLPEPARLLAAMEHGLPDCTGVALGFDRVVMLAAGARSIDEVIAFPQDRA